MRIPANTNYTCFCLFSKEEEEQEENPVEGDVQEEGEVIEIQNIEEMETAPGDWWQRVFSYDEAVEKIDSLPRQHRGGMKSVARKGGKGGKKGGKVSKLILKIYNKNLQN